MAPKVTSSSNRSKRSSAKPVTQGQNPQRANRQKVASKMITRSGAGAVGSPTGSGRTTYSEDRGLNKSTAKVTQGKGGDKGRPALPPGQRGGTPTKPSSSKPTPPRSNGGPVQPVRVRDMGKPSNSLPSGGARGLLGPGGAPPKAVFDLLNKGQPSLPAGKGGGRVNMGGNLGGLLLAAGGAAADYVGTKAGNAIGGFLRDQTNQSRNDPRRNTPGGRSNPGRISGKPATDGRYIPGSQQTEIKDRSGRQSTASRPEAPKLPAAVTRSSSGGNSSTPSKGGSTQRKGSSSSSGASSSSTSGTPAKPGQKWSDFNPNRGTSKTNNPLMKDMVARMKDREDKAQASSASKLTSKFNTESNFSGEKVDGSKYLDSLKKKKKKS